MSCGEREARAVVVPAGPGLVVASPFGPVQVPGDQGARGARRQVAGERGQQVEQPLRFRDGQRDGAAIGRRELIGLLGQDRGGCAASSMAVTAARNARAAMARVTCRFHAR